LEGKSNLYDQAQIEKEKKKKWELREFLGGDALSEFERKEEEQKRKSASEEIPVGFTGLGLSKKSQQGPDSS